MSKVIRNTKKQIWMLSQVMEYGVHGKRKNSTVTENTQPNKFYSQKKTDISCLENRCRILFQMLLVSFFTLKITKRVSNSVVARVSSP